MKKRLTVYFAFAVVLIFLIFMFPDGKCGCRPTGEKVQIYNFTSAFELYFRNNEDEEFSFKELNSYLDYSTKIKQISQFKGSSKLRNPWGEFYKIEYFPNERKFIVKSYRDKNYIRRLAATYEKDGIVETCTLGVENGDLKLNKLNFDNPHGKCGDKIK